MRPGDWDLDTGADTARAAAGPGVWVGSVHIARIADGTEPVAVVAVSGAGQEISVVVDPAGAVVPEGLR